MWDLVVVGAGPAGSATALGVLQARPGSRVLLLDRAEFPRDKPCGDGVAPHVLDVLAAVGAGGLLTDRVPVEWLTIGHAAGGPIAQRRMRRPAYVVPRTVLDARLLAAAVAAGAVVQRRRVRSVAVRPRSAVVDGDVEARIVVGADGAHSGVRSAVGLPASRRRAFALRGYAPVLPALAGRQAIVFAAGRTPAYAWSFDRGDGLANVGYGELLGNGPGPGRAEALDALDRLLPGVADGVAAWRGHHLPLSPARLPVPDGRVLLAGDAAGLVNPLTGEGLYYAVASGVLAGRAAAASLDGDDPGGAGARHRAALHRLLGRHLRHTAAAARLIGAPAVARGGIAAAAGDQRTFDELVELGLGGGLLRPAAVARTARATVSVLREARRSAAGA